MARLRISQTVIFILALGFASVSRAAQCTLNTPVPDGCGLEGKPSFDDNDFYDNISVANSDSLESCALLCARRKHNEQAQDDIYSCAGFYFDSNLKQCQLFVQDFKKYYISKKNTGIHFYNSTCFDCGVPHCPQPLNQPLLDNGGFENRLFGPWQSFGGRIVHQGSNSSQSYLCPPAHGYNIVYCNLVQSFNTCPNALYLVEGDFKGTSNTTSGEKIAHTMEIEGIAAHDLHARLIGVQLFPPSLSQWYTLRYLYQAASSAQVKTSTIRVGSYTSRGDQVSAYADNFRISRVPIGSVDPASPNLIRNGGFESGKLAPWVETDPPKTKKKITVSPKGLDGSKHAVHFPQSENFHSLRQNITTAPGTLYRLQFSFNATGLTFIYTYYGDEESQTYDQSSFGDFGQGTVGLYKGFFRANRADSYVSIKVLTKQTSHVLVDNISVKELS